MKNFFLLLLLAFSVSLSAQHFGIRAGINIANQSFNNDEIDVGNIVGYQLGLNYELMINENIAIRPGLLYATKGSSQKFPDLTAESRFHYIEVPVDFVYDLGVIDIFVGPYVGYAFKAVQDVNEEIIDIDFEEDNVKQLDLGINFGANIDINDHLYIGAYYSLGVSDISDNNDDSLGSEESIKNRSLSTFVTFRF